MPPTESDRERVPRRRCPNCEEWYVTKSLAEEHSDPTSCPKCGWKPGQPSRRLSSKKRDWVMKQRRLGALKALGYRGRDACEAYNNYQKGRHFLAFRKRALVERSKVCERCGSSELLQVHHLTYERLGNELMDDVEVVCRKCHQELHGREFKQASPGPKPSTWTDDTDDLRKRELERREAERVRRQPVGERKKKP